mmetsp:Transcript_54484/g.127112  ORF Transcript_54484/g.127112 Transcript_54484/m.127112 type:complete len:94 (+) Transcript_54484:1021-1302(+)
MNTKRVADMHEPLALTAEQCKEDVGLYLDEVGSEASLEGCLLHLQCVAEGRFNVPLGKMTAAMVQVEYVRRVADKLELSPAESAAWMARTLTA